MYLKLKLNQEEVKKKKRKTILWVVISHIAALTVVFLVFAFKGCSMKREQVMQVKLVSHNEVQASTQKQQEIADIIPPCNKPKKKIERKNPEKKKWKPLDPSQIKKNDTQIIKKYTPERNYKPVKASDIAASIRKNVSSIKFNDSFKANASTLKYFDKVSVYLYDRWKQPGRAAVGGGMPTVNVEISISSNGKVSGYNITKKSGIRAMDSSVSDLLANLSYLPAPPNGSMKIDVLLQLSD